MKASSDIPENGDSSIAYWDCIADQYQMGMDISVTDFHYGPLLPGDRELQLLPPQLTNLRCLELGCGAAQNSVYLAGHGAECMAVDGSRQQLKHAKALADKHNARVELLQADLDDPSLPFTASFDLIHSAYTLPFLTDQSAVIQRISRWLKPGGVFLFATAHPLAHAEWIEIEDGSDGIMLHNYFQPAADERLVAAAGIRAQPLSISALTEALARAGFVIIRLLEPQPVPAASDSDHGLKYPPPYDSPEWHPHRDDMMKIPRFLIIKAQLKRGKND